MLAWIHSMIASHTDGVLVGILFLSTLALLASIIALVRMYLLARKLRVIFSGKSATDLEKVIRAHAGELKNFDKEIQELFDISNTIHHLAQQSIHKIGIVRFNPFKDLGGDQSFAIALLDAANSGFVISSLHTREGTRIYAKPVAQGKAQHYELTEEEKRAIAIATPEKIPKIEHKNNENR